MDESDFERLEYLNAQMDIWIDEEEYVQVENACQIDKSIEEAFIAAFKEGLTCSEGEELNQIWIALLHRVRLPLKSVTINGSAVKDLGDWSYFFWAKLIRAKIQQKGTDCYFRRLDEVVACLERHLPIVHGNYESAKLAIIYLLEMASAGEGVDQRSFAERARRSGSNLEKHYQKLWKEVKLFKDFYDLVARYTRGVGYFHEGEFRKALSEFNYIIKKLQEDPDNKFFGDRLAHRLLLLPSILYRAEVQVELQLAYHALNTLCKYREVQNLDCRTDYEGIRANLIRAEAYQQMDERERTWEMFQEVCNSLKIGIPLFPRNKITLVSADPEQRYSNLRSKLQGLMAVEYLKYIRTQHAKSVELLGSNRQFMLGKQEKVEPEGQHLMYLIEQFGKFLDYYKKSSQHQQPNRTPYLELVAEYLSWLAEEATKVDLNNVDLCQCLRKEAERIYEANKNVVFTKPEESEKFCPCKAKGIALWTLVSDHYETYYTNMLSFFINIEKISTDTRFKADKDKFINLLEEFEGTRDNLKWRQREFMLKKQDKIPTEWKCRGCWPAQVGCFRHFRHGLPFDGLLACANDISKDEVNSLSAKDYEAIMDHWDAHFLDRLQKNTVHEPHKRALHFLGLQRWNSTSPAQGRSLGGGYLIYHTDEHGQVDLGVAVDPGFDFVRNLFHLGFSLADIDIVLLSHAHVDHVRDFESMLSLLFELRKRTKGYAAQTQPKLHTIMTLGVYRRLEFLIESPGFRDFVEPYIIDIEKEVNGSYPNEIDPFVFIMDKKTDQDESEDTACPVSRYKFKSVLPNETMESSMLQVMIEPKIAYHNDHSEYSDTFGFMIDITEGTMNNSSTGESKFAIGYTSDTSWHNDVIDNYRESQLLLLHLGSLIDRDKTKEKDFRKFKDYLDQEQCFNLIRKKNHPYFAGILHFLTVINGWPNTTPGHKRLVLMSEFGEEMRGKIRLDFVGRLQDAYKNVDVLSVDVGLDVLLTANGAVKPSVHCVHCDRFVPLDSVQFETYGHDEALFCVCGTCRKSAPQNVLQDKLRNLYEVGQNITTLPLPDES